MSKKLHEFCTKHQYSHPIETSCPKCRASASVPQVRRIITIARRMEARRGWDRRRAISFGIENVKRNPVPPKKRRLPRREMSDDVRQYLDHKNRSTCR